MNELFATGTSRKPPMNEVVRVRNWGRQQFGTGEDKWEATQLAEVRNQMSAEWRDYDLFKLKNRLMLSRKNKLATKRKDLRKLGRRLNDAGKAYSKDKSRRQVKHSREYLSRIESEAWRQFVADIKRECNYRCQLCGKQDRLDGHHTPEGYSHLGTERGVHVMALCRRCHDIADLLREFGSLEKLDDGKRTNLLKQDLSELFDIELVE